MGKTAKLTAAVLLVFGVAAHAADMGTPDEAKAMSEKAAALVNEKGEAAFADFSASGGEFLKKDLYVFCMDMEGNMLSHAVKPDLVGKNLMGFDKYGEKLFENMIETAK